jgi:hypothetical protein
VLVHPVSWGCNFIDLQGVLQPGAGEFRLEVVFLPTGRAIPRYFVFVLMAESFVRRQLIAQ